METEDISNDEDVIADEEHDEDEDDLKQLSEAQRGYAIIKARVAAQENAKDEKRKANVAAQKAARYATYKTKRDEEEDDSKPVPEAPELTRGQRGYLVKKAKLAAQKAAIESGETPDKLICRTCGPLPFEKFGFNAKTGKPLKRCKPCNVTMLEQGAKYRKTADGKAAAKRGNQSVAGKAAKQKYRESADGKATAKREKQSPKRKAAIKLAKQSVAGKERAKRSRQSIKGKEAAKRFSDRRTERRHESTAMQMDVKIQSLSSRLLSGRYEKSPTFLKRTGFASESEYRTVVESTFEDGVMTWENHGSVWQLDHKIPREAYDFDNQVDIKRCWSAKNVQALTKAANLAKSWKLIDQYVTAAGVENFPVSWGGKFPDVDFKNAHAAKMVAPKPVQQASEVGESSNAPSTNVVAPDSDSD